MKGENASREIVEGLAAIESVIKRRSEIISIADFFRSRVKIFYVVACGSSLAAGEAIAFWLRQGGMDARAIPSSEFYNYKHPANEESLGIFISQSGKTTETVNAEKHAISLGLATFAITNFSDSPLALGAEKSFSFNLEKEIAVMSTKAVDATLATGYIFAKSLSKADFSILNSTVDILRKIIKLDLTKVIEIIKPYRSLYVVGSGLDYSGAMELSIKIGEGALVQATPMYTLEVSHGPKAAASDLPAIIVALQPEIAKDYGRIIQEMKENRSRIISLSRPGIHLDAEINFELDIDPDLSVFAIVKFAQVLSLHLGLSKGVDPDSPPSLKKVVLLSELTQ